MGNGAYGASVAGPGFGTASGAGRGASVFCALPLTTARAIHSSAPKADPMVIRIAKTISPMPRAQANLRLERQRNFPRGTGVDQLDRAYALRLPPVLEENQSRHGNRAVAFR